MFALTMMSDKVGVNTSGGAAKINFSSTFAQDANCTAVAIRQIAAGPPSNALTSKRSQNQFCIMPEQ
jgi:hypothetical protein